MLKSILADSPFMFHSFPNWWQVPLKGSEIEVAADLLAGLQQRAGREPTVQLIELKNLWARYPDVSPTKIVAPLGIGQCSTPTLEQFTKDARELSMPPVSDKRRDTP